MLEVQPFQSDDDDDMIWCDTWFLSAIDIIY